ncbi:hypothetical protein ACQEU5_24785 [Marinactinospora thermotolerans]|uniref:hypothetical protein n=1 Tax=Marinactinospora thermotolerans TaxID=531310 RepID=UPI003D9214CE
MYPSIPGQRHADHDHLVDVDDVDPFPGDGLTPALIDLILATADTPDLPVLGSRLPYRDPDHQALIERLYADTGDVGDRDARSAGRDEAVLEVAA